MQCIGTEMLDCPVPGHPGAAGAYVELQGVN